MEQYNHWLREYDLFPLSTSKIKSVWKVKTSRGIYILKDAPITNLQLQFVAQSLNHLENIGFASILPLLVTKYGERGIPTKRGFAILTPWIEGETGKKLFEYDDWISPLFVQVGQMHRLTLTQYPDEEGGLPKVVVQLRNHWFERLNKMRECAAIAQDRIYPSPVDIVFLSNLDLLAEMANLALQRFDDWIKWREELPDYMRLKLCLCHGRINPFHFVMAERPILVNFDRANLDFPGRDLSYMLRYLATWMRPSPMRMREWLNDYLQVHPLDEENLEILRIALLYPSEALHFVERYYLRGGDFSLPEITLVRRFEKMIAAQQLLVQI